MGISIGTPSPLSRSLAIMEREGITKVEAIVGMIETSEVLVRGDKHRAR